MKIPAKILLFLVLFVLLTGGFVFYMITGSRASTLGVNTNLVQNSDFTRGTADWTFYTNGRAYFIAQPSTQSAPAAGNITVAYANTNTQIYQRDVRLESGKRYRLAFEARSNNGRNFQVAVLNHVSPYNYFGLNEKPDITTSWKPYTYTFTATNKSGQNNARIRFWFREGGSDLYQIRNVSLTLADVPTSVPTAIAQQPIATQPPAQPTARPTTPPVQATARPTLVLPTITPAVLLTSAPVAPTAPPVVQPTAPPNTGSLLTLSPQALSLSEEVVNPQRGLFIKGGEEQVKQTPSWMQSYTRYTWRQLEPAKDQYDFTAIDEDIAQMIPRKGKLTIKVRSLITRNSSKAYPDYLDTLMPNSMKKDSLFLPDWNDPDYIDRVGKLFQALAARYDNNPSVNFVEIGMYGLYGEWHMYNTNYPYISDGKRLEDATMDTLKKLIDVQAQPFKNKRVLMMTDNSEALVYAFQKYPRMGAARHSLGSGTFNGIDDAGSRGSFKEQRKALMAERWKTAPFSTEFMGPGITDLNMAKTQVPKFHVSLVSNGNYGGGNHSTVSEIGRLAGYRIELNRISLPTYITRTIPFRVDTIWRNVGNAPAYEPWNTTLQLRTGNTIVWSGKLNSVNFEQWWPGNPPTASYSDTLSIPLSVPSGTYTVHLQILDPENYTYPMRPAVRNVNSDNSITVGTVTVQKFVPLQ